tara:strand:- start:76 stop:1425 length:1350 start_codon:yes stop_codon:yes gene_type:complete
MINKKLSLSTIYIIGIIFICLFNIFFYDPIQGYDAEAHYDYVDYFSRYLPQDIRLPSDLNSREFFNPPIPYIIPSFAQVICRNVIDSNNFLQDCKQYYGIAIQVSQFILYLLTIFFNLKTLQVYFQSKDIINLNYLALVSLLAVNYRTISMLRGEPYILFFLSLLLYKFINLYRKNFKATKYDILITGILIGLLALSRQWAFLLFPAFFLLIIYIKKENRIEYVKFTLGTFAVGFITSSWFYFNLFINYGSFTAFNKPSMGFKFSNQPLNFYIPNLNDLMLVFSKPIRPNFSNQFITTLYSDFWGDYWGYFVFTSRNLEAGRNQLIIGDYLARVNIVSLPITLFLIYSIYWVVKNVKNNIFLDYIKYSLFFTLIGYLWFLISYPELPSGDTNKATYVVQFFNLVIINCSIYLDYLSKNRKKTYNIVMIYLLFAFIHNFSSYLSHFPYRF